MLLNRPLNKFERCVYSLTLPIAGLALIWERMVSTFGFIRNLYIQLQTYSVDEIIP